MNLRPIVLFAAAWVATAHGASPPAQAAAAVDVAAADNAFGFRLLEAIQKADPIANVVVSPVSAALDLSMVLNGAADDTRREMLAALSLEGATLEAINAANAKLIAIIRTPAEEVTLAVADSLWVNSRRAILEPEYRQRVQIAYDAEVTNLDFTEPTAAERINRWAAVQTHGKIPRVIEQVDGADLAVLLDAVYFKGQWTHRFDPAQTRARDFRTGAGGANGAVKSLPRMRQTARFDYFETPQLQGIRLPFGDGSLLMEILLPAESSSLSAIEQALTLGQWDAWDMRFVQRQGTIEVPRFELEAAYRLNDPLQALGMGRAFRPGGPAAAQFSGMLAPASDSAHAQHFFLSVVRQAVYWKMNEDGSEAAAVTSIGVRTSALARARPPFQMIVDRPFLCAIKDTRSGVLLFVGAIRDPAPAE